MSKPQVRRVDLDDSHIISIVRAPKALSIVLEQVRNGSRLRISVTAEAPYSENAQYYVGDNTTETHPDPENPLDYVEYAEQGANHLELGGYKDKDSWYTWRIESQNIQIQP